MLRVTVTRETSDEIVPIAEVVIGKFGGSEEKATYAARVVEPPSQYSDGVDACFAVRAHERYQPAFALVAEVLGSWRTGRTDDVNPGARAALDRALRLFDESAVPDQQARGSIRKEDEPEPLPPAIRDAVAALRQHADDPAMVMLARAVAAVAERLQGAATPVEASSRG